MIHLKLRIYTEVIGIVLLLFFLSSCKDDNVTEPEAEKYTGTLTVLQKDAYSNIAGRTSNLWPPHTTTVFKWENGTEVQLNHETAPDEVDAQGNPFLVVTKVYTFTATKSQMEAIQKAYKEAVCDDENHKFLGLDDTKGVLESSFLNGLKEYIANDASFTCNGTVSKDSLIALFESGEIAKVIAELPNCSWEQESWKLAILSVLFDVLKSFGHNISDYHVCNNDALMQVNLIKNFINTGKVTVPHKTCIAPMIFYTPE